MKFAILGPSPEFVGQTTKRLVEEARKQFKKVEYIPITEVVLEVGKKPYARYGKKDLEDYDYILPRIDSKRVEIGYPILTYLDKTNVIKPYPASTVLVAHNKFLTLMELTKRSIPVPETWITGSKEVANKIVDKQKLPIIMKLLSGFGGEGVMIMESKDAAKATIHTMKTLSQEVLIEEYIPNAGEDIRAIVAGDEIIASFKRVAGEGNKKANIHLGAKGVDFKLTEEMKEIVLESAKAIDSKLCAIDMVEGEKSTFVIEANINPGIMGIEKATNINVAKRIIDYVSSVLRR
jgi:ribosomal protein S6--L-glutamate ligase